MTSRSKGFKTNKIDAPLIFNRYNLINKINMIILIIVLIAFFIIWWFSVEDPAKMEKRIREMEKSDELL